MASTVEAVYENGVLKSSQPLPLAEHETVRVTISVPNSPLLAAYGIMGFKGTAELARHPELEPYKREFAAVVTKSSYYTDPNHIRVDRTTWNKG
jgi:predicted DNA-binding antitoxin AbrB/MazE fold protein